MKSIEFKDNKDKLLLDKLFSKSENIVLDALLEIKNGNIILFFPYLIEFYSEHENQNIKTTIFQIFIDIKNDECIPLFINAINDIRYLKIKKDLISIAWLSNLEFVDYLEFLVDIFISDKFEIAFEAFTSIECLNSNFDRNTVNKLIEKLNIEKNTISTDKYQLLIELINILETRIDNEADWTVVNLN